MQSKIQLTKKGQEELKSELSGLRDVKRPKLVDRLSNARSQGDLSENSDYQSAKEELEFLDGRIEELENVLKNAVVISESTKNGSGISVGTKVTVRVSGREVAFDIVGEWEADPAAKKISHESPLGKALIGKKTGDSVEVEAPAGKVSYYIKSVK